jgi:hypothetical protein
MPADDEMIFENYIDVARVREDVAVLDEEIDGLNKKQLATTAAIASRQSRRDRLNDFLVLAAEYRATVGIARVNEVVATDRRSSKATGKATEIRASARTLRRREDRTQTRIANILVDGFEPGTVFDLATAVERLREFLPTNKEVRPGHWIGTYLTREVGHANGILESAGDRQYRMRENAKQILEDGIIAHKPPQPETITTH